MTDRTCAVPGCTNKWRARDWCRRHYLEWLHAGKPGTPTDHRHHEHGECLVEGCTTQAKTRGWCPKHYARWRAHGDPAHTERPGYGTGRADHCNGYVRIWAPDHPIVDSIGYVMEHRKVMWDAGLLTDPEMAVHHINGDKRDNRIENLEVLSNSDHARQHLEERGYVRNQFGEWPLKRLRETVTPGA